MWKLARGDLVTLVELSSTQFGRLNGPRNYHIFSKFYVPPRALPTLAGVLMADGWQNVQMFSTEIHGENGKFSHQDEKIIYRSKAVLYSTITPTLRQTYESADRYKKENPDGIAIGGGMGVSYDLEEALKHFDIVVRGEGEETIRELINRLTKDRNNLEGIAGIALPNGGEPKLRELLTEEQLGNIPLPYYDEAISKKVRSGTIEQERGCPFNCNFCLVSQTYGNTARFVPNQKIEKLLKQLKEKGMGNSIFYTGDNFAGTNEDAKKALSMLEAIKQSKYHSKSGIIQVSATAAKHPEVLQAMRDAGISSVCVGFESPNPESLAAMGKPASPELNTSAALTFRKFGLWVHGMMIIGTDADNEKTIKETLRWAEEYTDSAQFFAPVPLPGTPYYEQMEREDRIITRDWNLYDGLNCVIEPAQLPPHRLQELVIELHEKYYSPRYSLRRLPRAPKKGFALLVMANNTFGDMWKMVDNPQTRQHLEFLKGYKK